MQCLRTAHGTGSRILLWSHVHLLCIHRDPQPVDCGHACVFPENIGRVCVPYFTGIPGHYIFMESSVCQVCLDTYGGQARQKI